MKILEISVGSISGLKSILLLVDLCTCRISDQNQKFEMVYFRRFFLVYKVQVNTRFMVLLPGIKQSLLVIVSKTGVYVIWSHSTSFMVLSPGIN